MNKYKVVGTAAVAAVLLAAVLVPALLPETKEKRVHQHLEAEPKAACTQTHAANELCTHLPLIIIDTDGVEIPGKPLDNHAEFTGNYSTAADGSTRIAAQMKVIDGEGYNHADDTPAVSSDITIRVRGRSSRYFDKSSYALTLVNEDGSNNDQSLLGMDAHHDWVLYGPYLDKTDLRNYMFYNISGEIMEWAPNVRYCEVILNSEYQGLYVLVESITAGKDGARLELEVNKKNQTYTGYIVRMDQNHFVSGELETFGEYSLRNRTDMEIVFPGASNLTDEIARSIEKDFSQFEKALYSYDYDKTDLGYAAYIDVDSFVDAFLIHEMTGNYDFGGLSTYLYKKMDGKLQICVWDFNNSCDNFSSVTGYQRFRLVEIPWYYMLMKDEDFTRRVIDRYAELRSTYFSDEYLDAYIDGVVEYLGPAIERDRARWESTYATGHGLLTGASSGRNPATYEEAITQLKTWLHNRLYWLDNHIDILWQYSAESKVKKFNEIPN